MDVALHRRPPAAATEETGQDTGFRRIGHLHLACTPQRVETVTREAAFAKAHGVPIELVGPEEVARHWPAAKVDDILTAAWVPDEGRANPADVTQAYAKGARMGGAQIVEGVTVTGFVTAGGRVTGVETDHGSIETETVVIAAGMWGRQLGALAGVTVPLQAAEHYYLLTDTVEWAHPDLPVVEDPDRYGYYREEAGGILVGLFEPKAAPWSLDRIPQDLGFAVLPPDWDRMAGFLSDAMDRFPSLHDAGIRQFFCGPESFTPDIGPLLGEAPELRGFFTACGLNSLGILLSGGVGSFMTQWILDGEPPMDVTGMSVDRTMPFMTNRAFRAERGVELLGALFGDSAFPSWQPWSGRDVRRSVVHDRLADAGADFMVLSGYEVPEWFADPGVSHERPQGWARDQSFEAQANEHRAVREAVGVMDMSFMAKILVQGPGAEALLNRVSVSNVSVPIGKIVYTQWLTELGGIWTDVTVTRLQEDAYLVVGADIIHRRMLSWLHRHADGGAIRRDHRHLAGAHAPDGARPALARPAVAAHHGGPVQRIVPLYARQGDRGRHGGGARASGHLPGRARLGAAHPDRLRGARCSMPCSRPGRTRHPQCRARRPQLAAAGEGLPGLRARHRQLRFPDRRGAGLHRGLGQAGRVHRARRAREAARQRRAHLADGAGARRTIPSRCSTGTSSCTATACTSGRTGSAATGTRSAAASGWR